MRWTYLANGKTLQLDASLCTGCGACIEVCPHEVFSLKPRSGSIASRAEIIDRAACIECGACARNCPVGAITVEAGVGCAAAVLNGIRNGTAPSCDCGGDTGCKDGASCC